MSYLHVCDNVVHSCTHECESGPPNGNNLADELSCAVCKEARQTNEPIATDPTQEDHVPFGINNLLVVEGEHFFFKR